MPLDLIPVKQLDLIPTQTNQDIGGEVTKDILGKIYAGASLPLRGAVAVGRAPAAGIEGLAELAGGKPLNEVSDQIQKRIGFPFETLQTDASKKATEKLGELMYEIPKELTGSIGSADLAQDINKPLDPALLRGEAKARSMYEMAFDAAMLGLPFKGKTGGKPITEAELQAGRKARIPPSSNLDLVPVERTPVPEEYAPMDVPEMAGRGPQSGVLERPMTPPPMDLEGMMQEQAMRQSMADQSARLSAERGWTPDMRGPETVEPRPRETLQMEIEQVRKAEEQSRSVETRDFPLRQEVLEQPAIKEAIDNFRMEAERLKDMPEQLAVLKEEFAAGMRQLGIDKPSDAFARPLYEGGSKELGPTETKLPIEKSGSYPSPSGNAFSDFARAKLPTEVGPWDDMYRAFVGEQSKLGGIGKKEGGALDPDVFLKGIFRGKEIPLEARANIGQRQLQTALADIDHLLRQVINAKKEGRETDLKVLVPELNAAREGLKRAQSYMDRINQIKSQPKAPILGMSRFGQRERGSVDFNSEDFKRFKDNLPEPMRDRAKVIYKAIMAEQEQVTPQSTEVSQREVVQAVPGLKKALEYIEPIENLTPEEIIQKGLSEPDLNFKLMGYGSLPKWLTNPLGRGITPGASLTAFGKKNTVVQYLAQEVNRAKIRANRLKHERLLDEKTGLKSLINKLDTPERVGKVLIEMEGKPGELNISNLNPREVAVVKRLGELRDQYLEDMNQVRHELGFKKDITKRDNWLPGTFAGDFQINVFRKHIREDGTSHLEMVGRFGRNDRISAEIARSKLLGRFNGPEFVVEQVRYRPISRLELREQNRVFSALEDMVGKDDPLFQTIAELKKQMLLEGPYEYAGVRKHLMPKKKVGIEGAKGFDPLKSARENSRDMFENTLQYFEQASDWIEMQRAAIKLKDILGSSELRSQRPELMKYVDLYWRTVSRQGTATSKAIDQIVADVSNWSGVGATHTRDATRMVKSALTLSYLTTPTFMGVQIAQPLQMMPAWMGYMRTKGAQGNPALAGALAGADMSMLVHKQFMTEFGRDAFKWAEENQALIPHMLDDIRPETMTRVLGGMRDVASLPLRVVEEYTRRYAYLGYAHFLRLSGMEVGPHLYETALNLTNMSMTDYRIHERPLIYQQLNVIGEAMSTLTAFKHNNYGQLLGFVEHSKEAPRLFDGKTGKEIKDNTTRKAAAAALLATAGGTMLFSGLSGVHFREDIDNAITALNDFVLPYIPGMTKPIPTTMGFMLKNLPDEITFGGVSNLTNLDLSSRFSQAKALPEMGAGTVFPYTKDVGNRIGAVASAITNPSEQTALQAVYINLPNIAKGPVENLVQGKDRLSPNIMSPEKGGFPRDEADKRARLLGGRSLKEAREQISNRQFELGEQFRERAQARILDQAKHAPWRREALAKKYAELSDNHGQAGITFNQKIKEYDEGPFSTPKEKVLDQAPSNPYKAKRRMDYERNR